MTPKLRSGIEKWGEGVLDKLGADVTFEIRNPLVDLYLDAWREQKLVGITRTARDAVTATLQNAAAEGLGIEAAKRALREKFEDMSVSQARMIARTEVVGASNAANLAAYQISGLVDGKEWLAVQDDSTRESHSDMDGQVRGISEEFKSPSGATTQGPGLFGVAGEDINCRCAVRPKLNDLASPSGEERAIEWRAYDKSLRPWENEIEDAASKVYGEWLGDAIRALG